MYAINILHICCEVYNNIETLCSFSVYLIIHNTYVLDEVNDLTVFLIFLKLVHTLTRLVLHVH